MTNKKIKMKEMLINLLKREATFFWMQSENMNSGLPSRYSIIASTMTNEDQQEIH